MANHLFNICETVRVLRRVLDLFLAHMTSAMTFTWSTIDFRKGITPRYDLRNGRPSLETDCAVVGRSG
jgi:hypothetical protein